MNHALEHYIAPMNSLGEWKKIQTFKGVLAMPHIKQDVAMFGCDFGAALMEFHFC